MTNLIAAGCVFLGIHLVVSGTALRDLITARIGETVYIPLFALASLGAIVWLCVAYNAASSNAANTVLFTPGPLVKSLGVVVLAGALALAVPGVLRGNPTSAGQEKARIDGVLRITRHPFLWGVTLWSAFHLLAKGTLAATVFFATFFLLATLGTSAIDDKVRRKRPDDWKKISAATSNLPFAAICEGRNRFVVQEALDWRFSIAAALYGLLLWFHADLFSAAPFPAEWLVFLTAH